jgi:hypothetical protein
MFTRKAALVVMLLAGTAGANADTGRAPDGSGEWTQIADGVYQRIGLDGTVYRDSVGDAGARYELALWKAELADQEFSGNASRENLANLRITIANTEEYLASAKPGVGPDSIVAFNNPPNIFCGFVAHQTADAWHLSNPGGGPSGSTSSITYLDATANSGTPTANFSVFASITPLGGTTTSVSGTSSLSYTASSGAASLLTRTTGGVGGAFQASYSTQSSVSVPGCSGGSNVFTESGTVN